MHITKGRFAPSHHSVLRLNAFIGGERVTASHPFNGPGARVRALLLALLREVGEQESAELRLTVPGLEQDLVHVIVRNTGVDWTGYTEQFPPTKKETSS